MENETKQFEQSVRREKAVKDIMEILTQDGMTYYEAKVIFNEVQIMLMRSSENFLNNNSAKEVLKTRTVIS